MTDKQTKLDPRDGPFPRRDLVALGTYVMMYSPVLARTSFADIDGWDGDPSDDTPVGIFQQLHVKTCSKKYNHGQFVLADSRRTVSEFIRYYRGIGITCSVTYEPISLLDRISVYTDIRRQNKYSRLIMMKVPGGYLFKNRHFYEWNEEVLEEEVDCFAHISAKRRKKYLAENAP